MQDESEKKVDPPSAGYSGGFWVSWGALWTGVTGWIGVAVFSTGAYFWAEHIVDRIEKPTATIIEYAEEKKKLDAKWVIDDANQHKAHDEAIENLRTRMNSRFWQTDNKIDLLRGVITGRTDSIKAVLIKQIGDLNFRLGQCIAGREKQ